MTYRKRSLPFQTPVSVAILGSCVTRDVFNRKFNPGYKYLFECVSLSNQNSVIALMGDPIDEYGAPGDNTDDATWREISAEARRSFLSELQMRQPNFLIIDSFADVHFGVSFDSSDRPMTANRWKFSRTHWRKRDFHRHLDPSQQEYFEQWVKANKAFLDFMAAQLPNTKILVHDTWNVMEYADRQGVVQKFPDSNKFEIQNALWRRYTNWYKSQGIETISAMSKSTKSYEDHPWGKFVVHFELSYHQEFLMKLSALVATHNAEAKAPNKLLTRIRKSLV